jgi:hypothetical protein
MLTPVKPISLQFTSDGTSTALIVDLSTAPVGIDFTGQEPTGILTPVATSTTGPITVSATLAGSIATFTFPVTPPQFDVNAALITYTLTFLLQFNG